MNAKDRLFLASALSLLLFACSGSAKIAQGNEASAGVLTPNSLTTASVQISAQTGGYVNVGSAQLKIPAQAIDQDTEITAEVVDIALPAGGAQAIGKGIRLKPEGLQFLVAAELEICYGPNDAANLNASQAMIYYQSHDQGFVGIAGNVDVSRRCIKSPIEHFSSYVGAAYAVNPGNTAPQFAGINFLPATPTPGVPLRVRVQINDVNGGATPGHVVAATLTYSFDGGVTQTNLPLVPDATDDTVTNRYYAEIPASQVSGTTFSYAITAVDNLNASRRTPTAAGTFTSVAIGSAATAIRFNPATFTAAAPLQISAGFSRQLALQVTSDGTTWQNISAENVVSLSSASLGSITRITPSSVRFNAVGAGSGQVIANVGSLSTSAYVTVSPGLLTHIEITDVNQVIISGTGNLAAGQTYDFDVIGFDSYGNIASVLPAMSTTGGIGSVSVDLTGLHFTAAAAAGSGSIIATLAGLTDSISLNLYVAPQVTATAPFNNTTGIALNASVGVTFSQVMDTSTLTTNATSACTGTLQVSSDNFATCVPMASATPSFYASNTLAVIQPAANLLGTTTYKIRVTAAARNTLNQPLVADFTTLVGFTTVAAPVVPAWYVNDLTAGVTYSNMCERSGSGDLYVVGKYTVSSTQHWVVKSSNATGAVWAHTGFDYSVPANDGAPVIACDNSANVYILGRQSGTWMLLKSTDGAVTFNPVSGIPAGVVYPKGIVINAIGEIFIAGVVQAGPVSDLIVLKSDIAGTTWTQLPLDNFSGNAAYSTGYDNEGVVMDAAGNLYVASAVTYTSTTTRHLIVQKYDGVSWSVLDDYEISAPYSLQSNRRPAHIFGGKLYVGGTGRDATNIGLWFVRECSLASCAPGLWTDVDSYVFENKTPDWGIGDFFQDQFGTLWSNGLSFNLADTLYFIARKQVVVATPWTDALAEFGNNRFATYYRTSTNRFFAVGLDYTGGTFKGLVSEYR